MKSLLEMNPNKLVNIVFIFVFVILPIIFILSGINFNATYYGIISGLALVVFSFLSIRELQKIRNSWSK